MHGAWPSMAGIAAVALFAGACGDNGVQPASVAPGPLAATAAPIWLKLQPGVTPSPFPPALVAPRGGRADFQVALRLPTTGGSVSARVTGASGLSAQVWRELDIPIDKHSGSVSGGLEGDVPDPLAPVATSVSGTARAVLLVSLSVPRDHAAGTIPGALEITAGSETATLPFSVRVANVTLPARHALRTWFDVWDSAADQAEGKTGASDAYHALLGKFGLGDGTRSSADTAVGVTPPDGLVGGSLDTAQGAEQIARAADGIRAARPDARLYVYAYDEPKAEQRPAITALGDALRRVAPEVRQFVTTPPTDNLGRGVGAYVMHLRDLTEASRAQAARVGAETWVYSSCCERHGDPTMLADDHATSNAAVAAATWLKGASGVLYWSVSAIRTNPYTHPSNPIDAPGTANGDGVLLYPGKPLGLAGPIPSLRLELFRAGLQLVDEAAAATAAGHGAEARTILMALFNGGRPTTNPATWTTAETKLLALT